MKKVSHVMKDFLLILEAMILLFFTLVSFMGTSKAVAYSYSYIIYYLVAVVGILFVGVLRFLRKKSFVVLLGILLIMIYVYVAFITWFACSIATDDMSFLKVYEGKEIVIHIGDETYEWNGEAFFHSAKDFELVRLDGEKDNCEINGEKQENIYCVRMKHEEPDKVYCPMSGVENVRYLVFVKRNN